MEAAAGHAVWDGLPATGGQFGELPDLDQHRRLIHLPLRSLLRDLIGFHSNLPLPYRTQASFVLLRWINPRRAISNEFQIWLTEVEVMVGHGITHDFPWAVIEP